MFELNPLKGSTNSVADMRQPSTIDMVFYFIIFNGTPSLVWPHRLRNPLHPHLLCNPVTDVAIRFFITRGIGVIVVAWASVFLAPVVVGKTGEGTVLAAYSGTRWMRTVATLSP